MSNKKKILIIQKVHEKGMELINNHPNFDVEVTDNTSIENLKSKLKDCDGASIRIAKLPGEAFEEAKNLKIISRHGVGYDNIDLKKAKEKDVKIAITANANAVTVRT
jgi:Phosphoglycerate dehydrogenase and related dehydrogenases